jgi:hypothetical protein
MVHQSFYLLNNPGFCTFCTRDPAALAPCPVCGARLSKRLLSFHANKNIFSFTISRTPKVLAQRKPAIINKIVTFYGVKLEATHLLGGGGYPVGAAAPRPYQPNLLFPPGCLSPALSALAAAHFATNLILALQPFTIGDRHGKRIHCSPVLQALIRIFSHLLETDPLK